MDKFNKFNEILKVLFQIKKPSKLLGIRFIVLLLLLWSIYLANHLVNLALAY